MMKVLAGDWKVNEVAGVKRNLLNRPTGLLMPKGFLGEVIPFAEVASVEIVSNRDSLSQRAGWAALGAVAFGPLGLLAGAAAATRVTIAVEFKDGRRALLEGSESDANAIAKACG